MNHREALWYAQARAQGRFALSPSDPDWNRLSRVGDFNLFVQQARALPWCRELLKPIGAEPDPHRIEVEMRQRFRSTVEEVARWGPDQWCESILWIRWLIDLPPLGYLMSGEPAQAWMVQDPVLAPIAQAAPDDRESAVRATAAAPLLVEAEGGLFESWLAHWRALTQEGPEHTGRIEERALEFRQTLVQGSGTVAEWTSAVALLESECVRVFRRDAGRISALLAFIALSWINLVRIRGALLRRLIFSGEEVAAC